MVTHPFSIMDKVLPLNHLNRSKDGSCSNRISTEGGKMGTFQGIRYFWCCNSNSDRSSVGCPFGHHHDIRLHSPVLDSKHLFSGSSPTRLDLIANKETSVAFDDGDDFLKVFFRWGDEASNPLDRFSDKGRDVAGGCGLNQFLN